MAAVLACGEGAVLSHQTAAALHGLRATRRAKIDVPIPRRSARRHRGVDVHRSTRSRQRTSRSSTAFPAPPSPGRCWTSRRSVNRRGLERAFDQAEALEACSTSNAILDQVERNRSRRGARRIKRVLEEHYIGSTLTESELEEAFFAICRRIACSLPEVQKWIDLGDGEPMIQADFVWRRQRVIVETDGRRYPRHATGPRARPAAGSAGDARGVAAGADNHLAAGDATAVGAGGRAPGAAAHARAGVPTAMIRQGWSLSPESPIVQCSVKRATCVWLPDTTAVRVAILDERAPLQLDLELHRRRIGLRVESGDPEFHHARPRTTSRRLAARVFWVQQLLDAAGVGDRLEVAAVAIDRLCPRVDARGGPRPRGCPARTGRRRGSNRWPPRARHPAKSRSASLRDLRALGHCLGCGALDHRLVSHSLLVVLGVGTSSSRSSCAPSAGCSIESRIQRPALRSLACRASSTRTRRPRPTRCRGA